MIATNSMLGCWNRDSAVLHVGPHDDAYGTQLAHSQIRYVCNSTAAAKALAENHVGLPF